MHRKSREKGRSQAKGADGKRRAPDRRDARERSEPWGFKAAFAALCGGWRAPERRGRGRKPRVATASLISALVFHAMQSAGTLGEHFGWLWEDSLCDSACADRRQRLSWKVFAELMRWALRPLARRGRERESFWRERRLVALDGTQFNLSNTPQSAGQLSKARTRRGPAAFAKIVVSVLLEVGLHNPIAAEIGRAGESEWALAKRVLGQLPGRALLLADRLYGCAAFAAEALRVCERVDSHFLFRVRSQCKVRLVRRLADGSRLVEVAVREAGRPNHIVAQLLLREIRTQVSRPGHRSHELRLWTNMLDPDAAPADELARLYAQRWEHELFYRQLKRQLRKTDLLQSHTAETGAQEIAALLVASALLARERQRAAAGKAPVLRVSFQRLLALMRPLWLTLAVGSDLLDAAQKRRLTQRFLVLARECLIAPRRSRSCPRALRQPMTSWPRLIEAASFDGPVNYTIV